VPAEVTFTNGAKDWIAAYERSRPPFRIRTWGLPQLRKLISEHLDVAFKHDVSLSTLRKVSDILDIETSLTDALWYGRKPANDQVPDDWPSDLAEGMRAAKRRMEEQYGKEVLLKHVENEWAWGFLSGKVSAIRWVLGFEWDMLDSSVPEPSASGRAAPNPSVAGPIRPEGQTE
jgi:hypothetical protein